MEIFLRLAAFLIAIFILILIHEFCHFWVAKRLGVKILRFSIGLGKPFYKWQGKDKTEYVLGIIPLGGYVKMLDSAESKVSKKNKKLAFDHKPIFSRFRIILAGVSGNILFSIFALWLVFLIGIEMSKPTIGKIIAGSPAHAAQLKSGDEIINIGNEKVANWPDVLLTMIPYLGEKNIYLPVSVKRNKQILTKPEMLDLSKWRSDIYEGDLLEDIGIVPYHPKTPAIINELAKNGAAMLSGLKKGDLILSVDKKPIKDWDNLVEYLQKNPQKMLQIDIKRQDKKLQFNILNGWKFGPHWKKVGYLGIKTKPSEFPKDQLYTEKYAPPIALIHAGKDTWRFFVFNWIILEKLITGKISFHLLGGPIMIWQTATHAFGQGFVIYTRFLAILSLALAFTNLLPIPGLDGGHLLFLLIETIRGKPVSPKSQLLFFRLGMICLILLMLQATMNDLMRFFINAK